MLAFCVSAEIVMFEGLTCVYRSNIDLYFYVIGSSSENEVVNQFMYLFCPDM